MYNWGFVAMKTQLLYVSDRNIIIILITVNTKLNITTMENLTSLIYR